jgi:hypothetical protein
VAKLTDRRFIKANVSDILTPEEFQQLGDRKGPSVEKEREVILEEEQAGEEPPMVPMIATKPKPKRKRSRNRNARKKRSPQP